MKHAPFTPTEADLRRAHQESGMAHIPFEQVQGDRGLATCLRLLAEARARRVPQPPEHFELTP